MTPAGDAGYRPTVRVVEGHTAQWLPLVRGLFQEYAAWLNVDLCFQGFEQELAGLPGSYAPPRGALLLAFVADEPAGCVALRPLADGCAEMKRLWVREAYRGSGVGRTLALSITERAAVLGYQCIRLDTLAHMRAALALYRRLGFREIPAYYSNPLAGTVYLEKVLPAPTVL